MSHAELIALTRQQFEECIQEIQKKNLEYSGQDVSQDALGNFKETARRLGVSSIQAWAVHFEKHVMAIESFVRTGRLHSETLSGRIKDTINYLVFLRALNEE